MNQYNGDVTQVSFNSTERAWMREALRDYVASKKFGNEPTQVEQMSILVAKLAPPPIVVRPAAPRAKLKVFFDSSAYERSHMKEPRGRGSWAFAFSRNPQIEDVLWTPSMTYGEATRWMRDCLRGLPQAGYGAQTHEANEKVIARFLTRGTTEVIMYTQS